MLATGFEKSAYSFFTTTTLATLLALAVFAGFHKSFQVPLGGLVMQATMGQVHARAEVRQGCNSFADRLNPFHGPHAHFEGSDLRRSISLGEENCIFSNSHMVQTRRSLTAKPYSLSVVVVFVSVPEPQSTLPLRKEVDQDIHVHGNELCPGIPYLASCIDAKKVEPALGRRLFG